MLIDEDDYLAHYGTLRRSGRYPWGSGGSDMQNHRSFLGMVKDLEKQGMSTKEVADFMGTTISDLRSMRTTAGAEVHAANVAMAQRLRNKGLSATEIAKRMDLAGESTARGLLAPGAAYKAEQLSTVANLLKDEMKNNGGYLDVGAGVEQYVNMSTTQFKAVLTSLRNEGYVVENVQVEQINGNGTKTLNKVLAPEGTTYRDIVSDTSQIKSLAVKLTDDGVERLRPPESLELSKLKINYAEDGGSKADGTMYIRPGAQGLDLGGATYAQVRIAVDGTHYLKGMAVLDPTLPKGTDVVFNTNKSNTGNPKDALKPMKKLPKTDADGNLVLDPKTKKTIESDEIDVSNPFGASIKPGGQRGKLNILREEGDWNEWSNSLPSQMLSKQKTTLIKEQLGTLSDRKKAELDEIMALTNPAVRVKLLDSFSRDVDSAAVHLQGAAMSRRQATQVILPVDKIKDTEIYAPNFKNGERVALIRYPHGGTFEIPELTVNNRQPDAKRLLKNAKDAVGINSKVAERLSGADFDGDTVVVIPNNSGKVQSTKPLEGLKGFDAKRAYPMYEGMKTMTKRQTQLEMGNASNLITDMTLKGANRTEIAAAVRHSMVVIDAEKHKLNWKQSAIDNGIPSLKAKYQGGPTSGASTLISRTTSDQKVPQRQLGYRVDPSTGEKIFTEKAGNRYYKEVKNKRTGEVTVREIVKTSDSTKGAEAKDAFSLSSGTEVEAIYATHSNTLKAIANKARKEQVNTKPIPYSPSAKKVYAPQVESLNAKLNVALKNAPRERQAQVIANAVVRQKKEANPDMQADELKKVSAKALNVARERTGAAKDRIVFTPTEWEAVQAGAISNHKLSTMLSNADLDVVKQLATPRVNKVMTTTATARAKSLLATGRTSSEVAEILGIPLSTLTSSLKE